MAVVQGFRSRERSSRATFRMVAGLAAAAAVIPGALPALPLSAQTSPAAFSGDWVYDAPNGSVRITQTGTEVRFEFTQKRWGVPGPHFQMDGSVNGRTFTGRWRNIIGDWSALAPALVRQFGEDRCTRGGTITALLADDGRSLRFTAAEDPCNHGWVGLVLQRQGPPPTAAPAGPPPADFSGDWFYDTPYGSVRGTQTGTEVRFDFTQQRWGVPGPHFQMDGSVNGRAFTGRWRNVIQEWSGVAPALGRQFGEQRCTRGGTISAVLADDGRSLRFSAAEDPCNHGWVGLVLRRRGDAQTPAPPPTPPPAQLKSLTGAWVQSADGSVQTPDSKVIIIHSGNEVSLLESYRTEGTRYQWQTRRCVGPLAGDEVRLLCAWVPGGNPMGFGDGRTWVLRLSSDRDHLTGSVTFNGVQEQAIYLSRVR